MQVSARSWLPAGPASMLILGQGIAGLGYCAIRDGPAVEHQLAEPITTLLGPFRL
jgi:hypothetical protein